jgi:hypothetical protein
MNTIDRLGTESLETHSAHERLNRAGGERSGTHLIILRCTIPSAAGSTNDKKSEGVIHDGTANTANVLSSAPSSVLVSESAGLLSAASVSVLEGDSRKM